ncbi:MAG TPA: glycosyltransferase [Chitinophagales bacterium]|nr:glycosyltransferase [Chitinophagales bacterium]
MNPKVSVCLITYNHEAYITEALEGIMMQQCTFDFEVVIGNDCSTDNTLVKIKPFLEKYADKIRLHDHPQNLGMTKNWVYTMQACRGEYVAIIEGDDNWTDPLKLQAQIDILDRDRSLSFCCHDVDYIYEQGLTPYNPYIVIGESRTFTIEDILRKRGFIPTCSITYRRAMLPAFPEWADRRIKSIDLVVQLMLAANGPFYYLNKKMGRYRLHPQGISHVNWNNKKNQLEYDNIFILGLFNSFSKGKFKEPLNDRIEAQYHAILKQNIFNSPDYNKAIIALMRLRPRKNLPLFKGWLINKFIPANLYNLYRKFTK